jgi:hypothetical protein
MQRPFPRVLDKTAEARFFLGELAKSWNDERSNFFFSAFASASRSITFTMQAVCRSLPGFDSWYATQRKGLGQDDLARFLLTARNQVQKVGLAPLRYRGHVLQRTVGSTHYCRRLYRFVPLEDGVEPPIGDAAHLCRRYLVALAATVQACYSEFARALDPSGRLVREVRSKTTIPALKAPRCPVDRMVARHRRPRR